MIDPIVTHADLADLERVRKFCTAPAWLALLDRLIAAAKADSPPLPEGWVLVEHEDGSHRALWHQDGTLWTYADGSVGGYIRADFKSVTPLRPTVTEADVERAAEAAWAALHPGSVWANAAEFAQIRWRNITRAALTSADIEVQS